MSTGNNKNIYRSPVRPACLCHYLCHSDGQKMILEDCEKNIFWLGYSDDEGCRVWWPTYRDSCNWNAFIIYWIYILFEGSFLNCFMLNFPNLLGMFGRDFLNHIRVQFFRSPQTRSSSNLLKWIWHIWHSSCRTQITFDYFYILQSFTFFPIIFRS